MAKQRTESERTIKAGDEVQLPGGITGIALPSDQPQGEVVIVSPPNVGKTALIEDIPTGSPRIARAVIEIPLVNAEEYAGCCVQTLSVTLSREHALLLKGLWFSLKAAHATYRHNNDIRHVDKEIHALSFILDQFKVS